MYNPFILKVFKRCNVSLHQKYYPVYKVHLQSINANFILISLWCSNPLQILSYPKFFSVSAKNFCILTMSSSLALRKVRQSFIGQLLPLFGQLNDWALAWSKHEVVNASATIGLCGLVVIF